MIFTNFVDLEPKILHAKFKDTRLLVLKKNVFKGVLRIRAWPSSWSCDLDHL